MLLASRYPREDCRYPMKLSDFLSLAEVISIIVAKRMAEAEIKRLNPYSNLPRHRSEAWLQLRIALFGGRLRSYLTSWGVIIAQVPADTWHEYYPEPTASKGSW